MAMKGIDLLILANTGTVDTPTWTVVGGQRGATLNETNETVETTSKSSNGAREYEYGLYGWTISCEGVYIPSDSAYTTLVDAMRNKTKVKVRVQEEGTDTLEGEALIISRDLEGPYDGEATYAMELQGTGALTDNPV